MEKDWKNMRKFLVKKPDIIQRIAKTAAWLCIIAVLTGCGNENKEKAAEKAAGLATDQLEFLAKNPAADVQKDIQEYIKALAEEEQEQETDDNPPPDFSVETPAACDASDGTLYESFLKGQAAATVREDFLSDVLESISPLEKGKSYTLEGLGKLVNYYYLERSKPGYTDRTTYDEIQYAYIGCLDGDAKNLLIMFRGLDIYCENDGSYTVMAVTAQEGRLYITYQYDAWPRSVPYEYTKGQIAGSGSNGAGDHSSDLSVILADGTCERIYDARCLCDEWIRYANEDIFAEVCYNDDNIYLASEAGWQVDIITIGGTKYYQYYQSDTGEYSEEQKAAFQEFIDRCREEASIDWVSDEVVEEAIEDRCVQLGFHYENAKDFVEAEWISLPSDNVRSNTP